jgi:DNA-binding NarL/FixJ family response regulator
MQAASAASPASTPAALDVPVTVAVCARNVGRDRICAVLRPGGLAVVHEGSDAAGIVAACATATPDLIVIGVRRPDSATLDPIRALRGRCPSVRVILVCERSARGDVRRALDAGARAIVLAAEIEEVLLPVVRVVCAGQVSVPSTRAGEAREQVLTTRQKQILGLVVMGMSNAQIASKLFLAESTVKSHLSSAFAKLDVSSRNEAVKLILDPGSGAGLGILTIPAESLPLAARGRLTRPGP